MELVSVIVERQGERDEDTTVIAMDFRTGGGKG
jgi:hypothetical protein